MSTFTFSSLQFGASTLCFAVDYEVLAQIQPKACAVWGRHHYKTFDGKAFSYNGEGAYIMAMEMNGDSGDITSVSITMDQGYQCKDGMCQTRVIVSVLSLTLTHTPS